MSNKKQQIPDIRFKGFTDDWEQRKLGEESIIVAGGDVDKTKVLKSGKYPVLANALTNDGIFGYYEDDYRIEAPAVTVTGRGDVGYAKARKTNFTPVVRLLAVKSEHDVDFLEVAINNHKTIVESTGVPQLTAPQLSNYNICFPSFEEEKKIGAFFKHLDDTITLHQRQLYYYKELKKATLQKMFPREGEKVPEVRFDGYTGEWELRKLGELAFFSKGTGYTKGDLTTAGKPIILYGRLYTKYETIIENVDTFVVEKEKSVISAGNEVIVPASGETSEDISRASVVAKPGIILGGDLNIIKPKTEIDPAFLALTISNGRQQKELSKKAQGKSVVHLHNSDLKEVDLVYPQKEEQSKIGTFFKHLDDTINLHQQKVKDYQKLKEVVLKQVFV